MSSAKVETLTGTFGASGNNVACRLNLSQRANSQRIRSVESKTCFRGPVHFRKKELLFSLASTGLTNDQRDGQDCSHAR